MLPVRKESRASKATDGHVHGSQIPQHGSKNLGSRARTPGFEHSYIIYKLCDLGFSFLIKRA